MEALILPFLTKKQHQGSGITIKTRQPDEDQPEPSGSEAIEACASDLIKAIHSHDMKGTAEALKSAFEILESQPHEEESIEPHSYEASKE